MAKDFTKLAIAIAMAVIGVVVLANLVAGLYPTLTTTLTTLNNTGTNWNGSHDLDANTGMVLTGLIKPSGVIPLIVIAVFVIGIIYGLFVLIKKR